MKAAIILATLGLAMAVCSAGGSYRHGLDYDYVEHFTKGKQISYYGYNLLKFGAHGYRYKFNGRRGRFAAGSILFARDEEKCGWKGIYDCDSNGCDEDPVCKAVLTPCGDHGAKCGGHEVCGYNECYEYECDGGYKCFEGEYEVCAEKCYTAYKEVCEDKKVYVCKRGRGHFGRRLAGDWGEHSDSESDGYDPDYYGNGNDSEYSGDSESDYGYDPEYHGRGRCGFVKKEVCKKVPYKACKEVCKVEDGYHCTDEPCGSDPEMASCGDGYCRLGDECYQPGCDKYCAYNKKHFCW